MATKNKKTKQARSKKSQPKKAAKSKLRKRTAAPKRAAGKKKSKKNKPRVRGKHEDVGTVVYEPRGLGPRSAGQSGDLQGLSNHAGAGSESVDELLEEGNAFEAEVIKGVEDVRDADEGEVYTHEVPEDDVPKEYLEQEE